MHSPPIREVWFLVVLKAQGNGWTSVPGNNKRIRLVDRREIIIKAAGRLFREKGYEGTSVRDLADAVGLQSGSLFFHFRSKEEILLSLLEGGLRRAVAILDRHLAQAVSPREKLSAILHGHLQAILDEERDAFYVVLRDWRTLSPRSRRKVIALRDEYESRIASALGELAHSGLIPRNTRLFRLFLLGALNWTVQWYRPDGNLKIGELADSFLDLMLPKQAQVRVKEKRK
jgi:TetR/AcrR family transcriptional regulator, cholesterol catabolism regulator